jgi:hypothetical protein
MAVIRIPDVMKVGDGTYTKEPRPLIVDGYFEFQVPEKMKIFWDSLSERERETVLNISMKERRDLRDVLSEEM